MKITIDIKLILLFQVLYQLQNVRSSFEDTIPDEEDSEEINDESASEQRHSHRHRHAHRSGSRYRKNRVYDHDHDHDHDHEHDHNHDHDHLRNRVPMSSDYDDCECSCNKCDNPSVCCKSACRSCSSGNPYQPPGYSGIGGQSRSSVVYVPYPYPMVMPSPVVQNGGNQPAMRAQDTTLEDTTTTTTSTTSIMTTTEEPTDIFINSQNNNELLESVLKSVVNDYSNIIVKTPEKLKNGNNKYMLTSLRRSNPNWLPKFGIVPISNGIAEKLIKKLRTPARSQKRVENIYDRKMKF